VLFDVWQMRAILCTGSICTVVSLTHQYAWCTTILYVYIVFVCTCSEDKEYTIRGWPVGFIGTNEEGNK
jgi:hypothetical protein